MLVKDVRVSETEKDGRVLKSLHITDDAGEEHGLSWFADAPIKIWDIGKALVRLAESKE